MVQRTGAPGRGQTGSDPTPVPHQLSGLGQATQLLSVPVSSPEVRREQCPSKKAKVQQQHRVKNFSPGAR